MLHLLLPLITAFCPDCNAACPDCKLPIAAIQPELGIEQTLVLIKPDALSHSSEIVSFYEGSSLKIIAKKKVQLTTAQAASFYAVHKDRPFFNELVTFMTSGPVEALLLEGEDAVAVNRELLGATNPSKASPGSIRAEFGTDVLHNAVHGSDSPLNAQIEIAYFFSEH